MEGLWELEVRTEGREVYVFYAESREEAIERFENGQVPESVISEVLTAEVVTCEVSE